MASLKDVAKLANVSLMTVSRAINEPQRLRPETYQTVMAAVEALGYVSDASARKIRGARSTVNTIGVLALDTMTTPFSVEMTLSIEETARAHGWNSFVVNMFSNDQPGKIVDLLLAHRPDGIIYTTMGLRQVPVPEKLLSIPCVLANCESLTHRLPSYIPNDEEGQYLGVKALLAAGHRKLLCIHLPQELPSTARRRAGLERACREAGVDPDALLHHYLPVGESHHIDAADILMSHLDGQGPTFDAVVCGNDRVAFVAYQVLLARGLRIPEDVAVLGYDNMVGTGELFVPALSTVQLPHYEIGRLSALHLIQGETHQDTMLVDSPYLPRRSILPGARPR
ncbi:LacI family DNA-binding transcriptional regulator [Aeromonas eucrenophila]|uniref:LacI family DNA-binding transcriptional regulator n=1 Tax=Aeromonas eucrenophila TaxID=649 RepID=UPI0005B20A1E|nr:LacI family DNA-binding transcriptional regulator [Aeromonas eucrenophila]